MALHTHEGHLHMLDDESFEMLASTKLYKQRVASVCSAGDLVFCGHDSGSVRWATAIILTCDSSLCTSLYLLWLQIPGSGCCITRRLQEVVVRSVAGVGDRW